LSDYRYDGKGEHSVQVGMLTEMNRRLTGGSQLQESVCGIVL